VQSSYTVSLNSGAGIHMDNKPIHYASEVHFNSNTRFRDNSANYTIHRAGTTASGGLLMQNSNDSTQGYFYWDTSGIGILSADGTWSVRNTNSLTDFYNPVQFQDVLRRTAHNTGHLEGSYNNVGSNGSNSNPIYTIGSSYNPASTTLGNMYGIGYTNSSASFISGMNVVGSWGMYVASDGDARVWLDGQNGNIHATSGVHAYSIRGHSNVSGTGNASYHPDGIYSTGSNWLYGTQYLNGYDTYFAGGSIRTIDDIVSDQNYGYGVVGLYSPSRYQHVWSMGSAYRLAANGASSGTGGNLYGLAWSYNPNYSYTGSNAQSKSGLNHQLLLMSNGTTTFAAGVGVWTSGNVTAYSDRRVKTNIEVIPDAVSKVKQLSGYVFDRTDVEEDPATGETNPVRQTGVIAQEVLEVLPEAVMGTDKEGYSVAYGNMVGLLIEAIKEQQGQIEDLKQEIQTLKGSS